MINKGLTGVSHGRLWLCLLVGALLSCAWGFGGGCAATRPPEARPEMLEQVGLPASNRSAERSAMNALREKLVGSNCRWLVLVERSTYTPSMGEYEYHVWLESPRGDQLSWAAVCASPGDSYGAAVIVVHCYDPRGGHQEERASLHDARSLRILMLE